MPASLLPCPFCGVEVYCRGLYFGYDYPRTVFHPYSDCVMAENNIVSETDEDLAVVWNKRADIKDKIAHGGEDAQICPCCNDAPCPACGGSGKLHHA